MIDHRRIQRTLFRMQNDACFAAALLEGDAAAGASTGLGERELALVRTADPAGLAADRDGERRAQFLRNITAEFGLSLAVAGLAAGGDAFAERFLGSLEFHAAIAARERLAYAFAAYAQRCAEGSDDPVLAALAGLESAMARARRTLRALPELAADEVAIASHVSLSVLPAGTFELAARIRAALDAGRAIEPAELDGAIAFPDSAGVETVLLVSKSAGAHRLRDVDAERLEPLVTALLRAAERPLDPGARAAFAATHDVTAADVEEFVSSLVAEKILARG